MNKKQTTCILWHRKDLRLADNPALHHALEDGYSVLPVYIHDPESEGDWAPGGASLAWLHHSLKSLEDGYHSLGGQLILRKGDSLQNLEALLEATGASAVYWNRRYEPTVIKRDSTIKEKLRNRGVSVKSYNAALLAEPWDIQNKSDKPFQVFTPFWKHHRATVAARPPLPAPIRGRFIPYCMPIAGLELDALDLRPKLEWDRGFWKQFSPGEKGASESLREFIQEKRIQKYQDDRNRPDLPHTSRLSPHLHFGEISPSTIQAEIEKQNLETNQGASVFMSEVGWREFAYHLLYHFPHTTDRALKEKFDTFPWEENSTHLENWKRGQTGIPIIDAGMRELWQTGWMHNRVRMIVASYLVKNLLVPWQEGARWFWDTLVDADLASNSLGWQWVAGAGADAAPYFRIFNPVLQSQKFDPNGDYIRKWITELRDVRSTQIHTPWRHPHILESTGYPDKHISLIESRNRALDAYKKTTFLRNQHTGNIHYHNDMYEFKQTTTLQHPIEKVYEFFSNAENLEKITPSFVGFKIISPTPINIQQGTLIDYRLKIHGFPIKWRTRISQWEPPFRFVDEQLKGPYQQWIHEHTFESIEDGRATKMVDYVRYSIFAGALVHFLVRKDIERIFAHRTQVIQSIFPDKERTSSRETLSKVTQELS